SLAGVREVAGARPARDVGAALLVEHHRVRLVGARAADERAVDEHWIDDEAPERRTRVDLESEAAAVERAPAARHRAALAVELLPRERRELAEALGSQARAQRPAGIDLGAVGAVELERDRVRGSVRAEREVVLEAAVALVQLQVDAWIETRDAHARRRRRAE